MKAKAVVVAVATAVALAGCAGGESGAHDEVPTSDSAGDAMAASCAQEYSIDTLADRDFAFDGRVSEIDRTAAAGFDDGYVDVTFAVHEWFRGGTDDTVRVEMLDPDVTTSMDGPAFAVGTRLLVSGEPRWGGEPLDAAVAWTCGFTRAYDSDTAAQWRAAL